MKRILLSDKISNEIIVKRSLKIFFTQVKVLWVLLPFCIISNTLAQEWIIDPSPNPRANNRLNAVVAISSTDAWAVGYYADYAVTPDQTLTLHWDGNIWLHVPSPNVNNNGYLNGIAAVSSNDVWAVGVHFPGTAGESLIMHWDGSNWSVVPSPNREGYNELLSVDAIAADNVWAVGYGSGPNSTLVQHWDGTQWSIVPSPPLSFTNDYILTGVSAVSANDIWAVGYADLLSGARSSLIEHWDGSSWTIVPNPNPGDYVTTFSAVTAVSVNDVWAAGWYSNDGGDTYRTLFEHWNGTAWSVVPSSNPSSYQHFIHGISAVSANDIWAVGDYTEEFFEEMKTMILHWNGTNWSIVSSLDPGLFSNSLYAVATLPSGEAWAVGRAYELFIHYNPWQTLIEHQHLVVPVELTSFTADINGRDVILNWTTASEINNSGFEIEKNNGIQGWRTIGFIQGSGTTQQNHSYSFTDYSIASGKYSYRLKQVDYNGSFEYSDIVEVEVNNIPAQFSLEQNYPNPFNPSTIIRYHLPLQNKVTIEIFNILGREIATLIDEIKEAGIHEIEFTNNGNYSSGIYFYTMQTGDFIDTKKFVMIK